MLDNPILDVDSYKLSHYLQFPQGMSKMFSYIEARGGEWGGVFVFGLQYILKRYLTERITMEMVDDAAQFATAHGEPFPYDGWKHIATDLGGKLPLRILAVPEGTWVPHGNIIAAIESTDETVPWIVSWMETQIMRVWYPITVATQSLQIKKIIVEHLKKTSDKKDWNLPFRFHDFGARGVTCREQAGIGGMAHLAHWMGTDTDIAISYADEFYYAGKCCGFSIPAAEHSTITSWGKDNEFNAYQNMVSQFAGPGKIFACVSDSYDIYNAVGKYWCDGGLLEQVKKAGGCCVIRPDSGDATEVVPQILKTLERHLPPGDIIPSGLWGLKMLPPYVRIIQGDGVGLDTIGPILDAVRSAGFATANITFGSGGANLQKVNRDTCKFAMKCSEVIVDDRPVLVYKEPVTDIGKRSKAGRLDLVRDAFGNFTTIRVSKWLGDNSELKLVFENGELIKTYTLQKIRDKSNAIALG